MIQSYMILGLVDTLSPALDSKFRKARKELRQKLRELKEQPPLVRTEGNAFSIFKQKFQSYNGIGRELPPNSCPGIRQDWKTESIFKI